MTIKETKIQPYVDYHDMLRRLLREADQILTLFKRLKVFYERIITKNTQQFYDIVEG